MKQTNPHIAVVTLILGIILVGGVAGVSRAAAEDSDPCAGYKWDVSRERALFAGPAQPLRAGKDAAAAPVLESGHLYALELAATSQVAFAVAPGKASPADGTYAGVLHFRIPKPGKYRVAIDEALWVDVEADGRLLSPADYEGVHGCSAPRKIVVFTLDAKDGWLLQVSGADRAAVRVSITPAE
jgi:hypothetical protein